MAVEATNVMSQPPAPPEQLMVTKEQAASLCSMSMRTLDQRRAEGRFPRPVVHGKTLLWSYAELRAWVNAGCPAIDG